MERFVRRLLGLTWEQLSPETLEAAKLTLIDSLGALVFGNREAENLAYASRVGGQEAGQFAVIGTPYRLPLKEAAFVNGCGSVATEMDEGNQWSKGHPAAHVVPTLLTYAQRREACDGRRFLLALIGGYEAASRFGRATTLLPAAHAHGTWGIMGAAASCLLLEEPASRADERTFLEGLRLSASFALPTLWSAALQGALVRNAYMGHAIEMAVRTAELLQAGYRAPEETVDYVYGQVLGTGFDAELLAGDVDGHEGDASGFESSDAGPEPTRVWDIERNYFKPYAFCRYSHAPIDAFGELIERHGLKMENIREVEVSTYSRAATLNNRAPRNVLSAKFSIPYALAVRIATGRADQDSFAPSLLTSREVLDFASRVTVVRSEKLEADYPTVMPAVVRITTGSGEVLESRCDIAAGGPGRPLGRADIERKFRALTAKAFAPETQTQILSWIGDLEKQDNVNDLIELCTPEGGLLSGEGRQIV